MTSLLAVKDRQDRWQSFSYNEKGQLESVWASQTPGSGTQLDALEYGDGSGLLTAWTNAETRIEFSGFNFEGRPAATRQIRYAEGSGFGARKVLDDFTIVRGNGMESTVIETANMRASHAKVDAADFHIGHLLSLDNGVADIFLREIEIDNFTFADAARFGLA